MDDESVEEPVDDPVEEPVDDPVDDPAEAAEDEQAGDAEPFERPVDKFRRGAVGSVVAAGLLGIADALEGRKKEEVAIVQEAPTPPVREPRRLELLLDPDDPSKSLVFLPDPPPASPPISAPAEDAADD